MACGVGRTLCGMTQRHQPLPWRAIVHAVAIVYGITFVAGLVFAAMGITPQIDPALYPLLALLVGTIGVAVALRVMDSTRPACLVALGVGIWLLSVTSVLVGAQSLMGWFESSVSIATTVLLGRLLLRVSLDEAPVPSPYATLVRSMSQTRRHV